MFVSVAIIIGTPLADDNSHALSRPHERPWYKSETPPTGIFQAQGRDSRYSRVMKRDATITRSARSCRLVSFRDS